MIVLARAATHSAYTSDFATEQRSSETSQKTNTAKKILNTLIHGIPNSCEEVEDLLIHEIFKKITSIECQTPEA